MAYTQYIFPHIPCPEGYAVEFRINYQSLPNINPDDGGTAGLPDSLDFYQSDPTQVVYISQQPFTKNISAIKKVISREDARIAPDVREFEMQDFIHYTGTLGDGTPVDHDLSGAVIGSLLDEIFDDPKACATIFCAQVLKPTAGEWDSGTAYSTGDIVSYNNDAWAALSGSTGETPTDTAVHWRRARHLYFVGDIDPQYTTKIHTLVHRERTTNAEQRQIIRVKAEPATTRMKRKTIKDFVDAIEADGRDPGSVNPVPFYGGYCLQKEKTTTGNYIDFSSGGLSDLNIANDGQIAGYPASLGLHFTSFSYLLGVLASDVLNYSFASATDAKSGFVGYSVDETTANPDFATHFPAISTTLPFSTYGCCYEVWFGIDPRITGELTQYYSPISFDWKAPVSDFVKRVCFIFGCYLSIEYDQTTMKPRLRLLDRRGALGNALPATWRLSSSNERERFLAGQHVEVSNTGDSDKLACPNEKGNAVSVEIGARTHAFAHMNGCTQSDLTYDASLGLGDQYQCWQLFTKPFLIGTSGALSSPPTWSSSTAYYTGDVVTQSGNTYLCSLDNTNKDPATTTGYWQGVPNLKVLTDTSTNFLIYTANQINDGGHINIDGHTYNVAKVADANVLNVYRTDGGVSSNATGLVWGIGVTSVGTDGSTDGTTAVFASTSVSFTKGQTLIVPDYGVYTIDDFDLGDAHRAVLDDVIPDSRTGLTFYVVDSNVGEHGWIGGSYLYYIYGGSNASYIGDFSSKSLATTSTVWSGAYSVNFWEYKGGSSPIGNNIFRKTDTTLYSAAQFYAAELLGNLSQVERTFAGVVGSNGYIDDVKPLDYWTEHINGATRTYRIIELDPNEVQGTTTVVGIEVLETLNAAIIDSKYPVVKVKGTGGGSSGSAGSGGSSGSSSGSSGSSSADFVRDFPTSAAQNNIAPTIPGVVNLTLTTAASHTGNLTEWRANDGTLNAAVDYAGNATLKDTTVNGNVQVNLQSDVVGQTIKLASGQTNHALIVEDNSSTVLANIDAVGGIYGQSIQDAALTAGPVRSDSGGILTNGNIDAATELTGIVPIANGGTNSNTRAGAINNLLPSQTGNATKYLQTDGTDVSWQTVAAGGTVTTDATLTGDGSVGTPLGIALSHANTWTGVITEAQNGITTTLTDGIIVANNTAATSGVPVQISPSMTLRSHVWSTGGGAANHTFDAKTYVVPGSGTSPTLAYVVASKYDSNAASNLIYVDVNGRTGIGGTAVSGNTYAVAIGHNATASGIASLCLSTASTGEVNGAAGTASISIGMGNSTSTQATALGRNLTSSGSNALAVHTNNTASGGVSLAAGINNNATGYGQLTLGQYNTLKPTSGSASFTAADPLIIGGNGTATTQAGRSYSWYLSGDGGGTFGGRVTTSDATGSQSCTGYMRFGFANNTTFAKVTSASHAADRTYTIDDIGANASFVMTDGAQTIANTKTFSGTVVINGGERQKRTVVTTTHTIAASERVIEVDGTSAGFTVTLNPSPTDGDIHTIYRSDNTANAITLSGTFMDGTGTLALSNQGAAVTIIYSSTTSKWEKIFKTSFSSYDIVHGDGSPISAGNILVGSTGNRYEKGSIAGGTYATVTLTGTNFVVDLKGFVIPNLTMASGSITYSDARITVASRAWVQVNTFAGTPGFLAATCAAGTVTVNSTSLTDASTVDIFLMI